VKVETELSERLTSLISQHHVTIAELKEYKATLIEMCRRCNDDIRCPDDCQVNQLLNEIARVMIEK